jgi:hypothetical protein
MLPKQRPARQGKMSEPDDVTGIDRDELKSLILELIRERFEDVLPATLTVDLVNLDRNLFRQGRRQIIWLTVLLAQS